jgi:hypothetical protein
LGKKQKFDLLYKFKGDPTDKTEFYRQWTRGVDLYLRYFKDEYPYDNDKSIFVGTLHREKALAWYINCEDQLKKLFHVDTWRAFIISIGE